MVLIAPPLLLLIMAVIQFALVAHARNVAEAAAQEGVAAARRLDSTDQAGADEANRALDALGPRMLTDRTVQVDRTPEVVTVTVTGTALAFIPGFRPQITEVSSGPIERYVPPVSNQP